MRKIPIIHYEGGDVTEGGALDDNIRHAITKLSNLHITSNQDSLKRIIKMGEENGMYKRRLFAISNINLSKFNYEKIKLDFNLSSNKPLVMFTMHPLVLKINYFLKS